MKLLNSILAIAGLRKPETKGGYKPPESLKLYEFIINERGFSRRVTIKAPAFDIAEDMMRTQFPGGKAEYVGRKIIAA